MTILVFSVGKRFCFIVINIYIYMFCLQCFDAVGWAAEGHPACKKLKWCSTGMVICLERDADLHMAQLMALPLTVSIVSVKSRLVLPFWYRLTRVVLEKGPLNACVCVFVRAAGTGGSVGT